MRSFSLVGLAASASSTSTTGDASSCETDWTKLKLGNKYFCYYNIPVTQPVQLFPDASEAADACVDLNAELPLPRSSEEVVDFGNIMTVMGVGLTSGNVVVGAQFYDGEWRDNRNGEKMTFYGPADFHNPKGRGTFLSFGTWLSPNYRKWAPIYSSMQAEIICQKSLPQENSSEQDSSDHLCKY